ncbi:MAG: PQQ-dependent dehydrogenase, methanol/ethanol family [Pseudomonadaceae bacterium]|nr:PQQ-dependent dehydrogenase, methanol/ethanol family [Pseudomonadaceae bacterium]
MNKVFGIKPAATSWLAIGLLSLTAIGCGDSGKETAAPETASAETSADSRADHIRKTTATINGTRIQAAASSEPGNWLAHGRTYDEQRYSPLKQINTETASDLGLAWYWDTGTTRGLESTPIVVDGVMYNSGSWSMVWAHDAVTGELLWEYDPQVPREWGVYACCDVVNRGVALWQGKVYVGTIDGRLVALDAATGDVVWDVKTTPEGKPYTITGAPRVVKGKVIIGNGGAEYGVRGYITAYDADTGDEEWRFYTVPGDPTKPFENPAMEHAASTWRGGEWWKVGGGGTVWDSMAFDPELDLLYVGTGNGSPWNRYIRSPGGGDNLYVSSILAIDPDNGALVWHYQTTPGDSWDYTATQHMILAELTIDGEPRDVLMQAPKNGFFYVIDRKTGEFISAENYVPVTWATHIDKETGRPVENPEAQYANETKLVFPAPYGGHNWHPMAYNQDTGLVYIPALDIPFAYGQDNAFKYNERTWNTGVDVTQTSPPKDPDTLAAALGMVKGHLSAWDPVNQKEVWRVQHEMSWNGGVLTTAGNLVFQGRADGHFAAYAADTGEMVWEAPVHVGIIAAPVSFEVDGTQYVSVVAGWGGAYALASGVPRHKSNVLTEGRILTFKVGGDVELPEPQVTYLDIPTPPASDASEAVIAQGDTLYHTQCSVCHGPGVIASGGSLPDLRYSSAAVHDSWNAIVRDGAYTGKGMAGFAEVLTVEESNAIQAYVISATNLAIEMCKGDYRENYPETVGNACVRASVEP